MALNNSSIHVGLSPHPENDQTYVNGTSFEYFDELLFSLDGLSVFTIITYLIGLCIIVPGFTGIIWYEKYGNHRNR